MINIRLDIRTAIFSFAIINAVCMIVMALLWFQNRKRFAGTGLWLANFVMQVTGLLLIFFRNFLPDLLSIVVGNSVIVAGAILMYMGLEHFVGKRSSQIHNYLLLLVYTLVHAYFTFIHPSLLLRDINSSVGIFLISSQCMWLMLRRVEPETRRITKGVGVIFLIYSVISLVRLVEVLIVPPGTDFFHLDIYDMLLLLFYQIMFIALAFGLLLMLNRRLVDDLEIDILGRKQVEEKLKSSEEKFFKAFHASPDAITITRLRDGKLLEVNEGFSFLFGYSREEALASSSINLGIWARPQDRGTVVAALLENQRVRDHEYDFRTKSGKILNGLYSGELIQLGNETHILSIVHDITGRKQTEIAALKLASIEERQRLARDLHDSVNQSIHSLVLFSETLVSTLEKKRPARAVEIAGRLQESARQALKEMRLMLYEIQPSGPESSVDLVQDLETRLATVERRAGVKAQIIQEGSMEHIPQAWRDNLFWITIEALNNALKHAQARNMQVILRCFPHSLNLEIVDDGIGFDPGQPRSGGLGLRNMYERAELLGGKLTIDSTTGKGTKVHFSAEIK